MKKQSLFVAGIICLMQTYSLQAQPTQLSLEQVWQKVWNNYPSLFSKQALVEEKYHQKELVKKSQLPEVQVQAQNSYGSFQGVPGAFFPQPGSFNISGNKSDATQPSSIFNTYGSAVLDWKFMQFGKIKNQINAADHKILQANASYDYEKLTLQAKSTQQYFKILFYKAYLSLKKADIARLNELFILSKSQADAGLYPGADSLLAKSAYLHAKAAINDQQAELKTANIELSTLLGMDTSDIVLNEGNYSMEQSIRNSIHTDSITSHPYLEYLQQESYYNKSLLEVAKRESLPALGLLAGAATRGSGISSDGLISNKLNAPWKTTTGSYLVGIGLTWNLSSLYNNKSNQQRITSKVAAAEADLQSAGLQLQSTYHSAIARLHHQMLKLQEEKQSYAAALEAYELYLERYKSGLTNMVEILQLQKELQAAERSVIITTGHYWDQLIEQSTASGDFQILLQQFSN